MALQKLDLVSLKYIAAVSLVENKCNPTAGVVIPIGGAGSSVSLTYLLSLHPYGYCV